MCSENDGCGMRSSGFAIDPAMGWQMVVVKGVQTGRDSIGTSRFYLGVKVRAIAPYDTSRSNGLARGRACTHGQHTARGWRRSWRPSTWGAPTASAPAMTSPALATSTRRRATWRRHGRRSAELLIVAGWPAP